MKTEQKHLRDDLLFVKNRVFFGRKCLFLDDYRNPQDAVCSQTGKKILDLTKTFAHDWAVVRSFEEFKGWIESHSVPDIISFDHDLCSVAMGQTIEGGRFNYEKPGMKKTGMHCALFLREFCDQYSLKIPKFYVHSVNLSAFSKISGILSVY